MEPVKPASGADGFSTAHAVRYDTRLEDILPVALGSDTAITVTGHDNHPIGTIGKKQILDALSVHSND